MWELNYSETKIEIGVKLRDQKCNFTYKKWSLYMEPLRRWRSRVNAACVSTSEINSQRSNRASRINFAGIYKSGDQIFELNYKGIKYVIQDKIGDQFCNFTYF